MPKMRQQRKQDQHNGRGGSDNHVDSGVEAEPQARSKGHKKSAKKDGWFSRRHETGDAHQRAQEKYRQKQEAKRARAQAHQVAVPATVVVRASEPKPTPKKVNPKRQKRSERQVTEA